MSRTPHPSQHYQTPSDTPATRWRQSHPVLVLKRAGHEHRLVLRPIAVCFSLLLTALVVVSVIGSAGYMFFRDDLMARSMMRYQAMEENYENRIAALRAEIDLVTSRQLIDQKAVETRVSELMARQEKLAARTSKLKKVLRRASDANALRPAPAPSKNKAPQKDASRGDKPNNRSTIVASGLRLGTITGSLTAFNKTRQPQTITVAQADDEFFDTLEATLAETERAQIAELSKMRRNADKKAKRLARILDKQGIRLPEDTAIGGPLIQLNNGNAFLNSIDALDHSLDTLNMVRRAAKSLPHGSPAPGQKISSRFGTRKDPFTGGRAMHGGLDFRARKGVPVIATASGKVTRAGRKGGYGKLVEIDHGGGITTRYAHLSKIRVKVGQKIERGQKIGNVGSTGRSTGPHLHYEVRRKGRVLNPIHYVRLEKRLRPYL